jgi:hypothetical protein
MKQHRDDMGYIFGVGEAWLVDGRRRNRWRRWAISQGGSDVKQEERRCHGEMGLSRWHVKPCYQYPTWYPLRIMSNGPTMLSMYLERPRNTGQAIRPH